MDKFHKIIEIIESPDSESMVKIKELKKLISFPGEETENYLNELITRETNTSIKLIAKKVLKVLKSKNESPKNQKSDPIIETNKDSPEEISISKSLSSDKEQEQPIESTPKKEKIQRPKFKLNNTSIPIENKKTPPPQTQVNQNKTKEKLIESEPLDNEKTTSLISSIPFDKIIALIKPLFVVIIIATSVYYILPYINFDKNEIPKNPEPKPKIQKKAPQKKVITEEERNKKFADLLTEKKETEKKTESTNKYKKIEEEMLLLFEKANSFKEKGEINIAISLYENALDSIETNDVILISLLFTELADCYLKNKNSWKAFKTYENAFILNISNTKWFQENNKEFEDLTERIDREFSSRGDQGNRLYYLSVLSYLNQDYDNCKIIITEAKNNPFTEGVIHTKLARLSSELQKKLPKTTSYAYIDDTKNQSYNNATSSGQKTISPNISEEFISQKTGMKVYGNSLIDLTIDAKSLEDVKKLKEGSPEYLKKIKELSKKNPDSTLIKYMVAQELISSGKNEDAINELEEITKRVPKNQKIYHQLGNLYIKEERISEGKKAIFKAMRFKQDPKITKLAKELIKSIESKKDG